jgi:hypothetical protein
MQAVGKNCAVCAKRIRTALAGIGCSQCQQAFHGECLEDATRCPRCDEAFEVLAMRAAVADARQMEREATRGIEGEGRIATVMIGAAAALLAFFALFNDEYRSGLAHPVFFGGLVTAAGLYLVACSTWWRTFAPYQRKARLLSRVGGPIVAHTTYRALGLSVAIVGILMAIERLPRGLVFLVVGSPG